jgi:hypothetical protein
VVDVLPVLPVPVLVEPAALVAEVGVDVAPVLVEGVTPVAVEAVVVDDAAVAVEASVVAEAPVAVEAPAVAVSPAEELVAAAGVLAA